MARIYPIWCPSQKTATAFLSYGLSGSGKIVIGEPLFICSAISRVMFWCCIPTMLVLMDFCKSDFPGKDHRIKGLGVIFVNNLI